MGFSMTLEKVSIREMQRAGKQELPVEENYEFEDLPTKGPVYTVALVELDSTGLTVSGRFHATVEEPCDRCYEPYEREIRESFEEDFVFNHYIEADRPGEVELNEEDFYEVIDPEGELDLKDLIRQLIVMGMQQDRLCSRETCDIPA